MIFKKWKDCINEDKEIVMFMWTSWCEDCEKQRDELIKISSEFLTYFNFIEENADNRPDLAVRYSPGVYPSISIIGKDTVLGGTFGFIDSNKLSEILLLALDLKFGGGKLVKPLKLAKGERPKWNPKDAFWEIVRRCSSYFDWNVGGFEREPKHPAPEVLRLLLRLKNSYFLTMVQYTLDSSIQYLWNNGFYLYSKQKDWNEPYPAKLLDMNVEMAFSLLEAYEILKDQTYLDYAIKTIEWIYSLRDKNDGLYPNAVVRDKTDNTKFLPTNSLIGELFVKAYEITRDEKYKSEYQYLSETLINNLRHKISDDNNNYLFLIDISYLLKFLSKLNNKEKIRIVLDKLQHFYGDDAYYDVTLQHSINEKIGRFKFLYDNSILASALIELGMKERAKEIVDYFLDSFTMYTYFNQAKYAIVLGMIYGLY